MIEGARRWPVGRTETAATSDEEALLVARAKEDLTAFAPLYARYLTPVYRYCYARLGDREAAEDATSQVFTRALVALPEHRGGSFGAWLFAIALNVVANQHRRPTTLCHPTSTAPTQAPRPTTPCSWPRKAASCGQRWPTCRRTSAGSSSCG
jgi:DNA-directed RNA polymerase specialized sigma24 family protein